jgi:small-conductance mechanosensitive channel
MSNSRNAIRRDDVSRNHHQNQKPPMPTITPKAVNRALWTAQGLLAALFLFAGVMKLVMPIAAMQGPIELPGLFLRLIGVLEILGALGLVLPGLFRRHETLTPLAACGLVGVMAGATVLTVMGMGVVPALLPFVVGLIALSIAVGRRATPRARTA